jgi:uncharacterized tellurite resistance protein B-like protein
MNIEKLEILRSIAEMAYVIAKADKGLSSEERIAFHRIIQDELDYDSWAAQSRFELLDEVIQPSLEKAYNEAVHDFRKYKDHPLSGELKAKAIRVMTKVAEACSGIHETELQLIERFKKDIQYEER